MLINGPKPKILFALDLDYTHFNSHAKKTTWLGSKEAWLAFYRHCIEVAEKDGVELIFAVVTNKPEFDDIAEEAAIAFESFLSIANPDMYIEIENQPWCLVQRYNTLHYECLSEEETLQFSITHIFSHFVINPCAFKTTSILDIAKRYNISPAHCLLLDDSSAIVLDAMLSGIKAVSFAEFCPDNLSDLSKLQDPAFVEPILSAKRQKILTQLYSMLEDIKARNQPQPLQMDDSTVSEAFTALMQRFDPRDCLYSWGSFRLFLNEIDIPLAYTMSSSLRFK